MKETEEEPQGTGQAAVTFIISLAAVGYMCYIIFGQMKEWTKSDLRVVNKFIRLTEVVRELDYLKELNRRLSFEKNPCVYPSIEEVLNKYYRNKEPNT